MIKAFLTLALLVGLIVSSVALVDARQEGRVQFIALSKLERERDQLDVEYGKLKIQQAMLTDTNRIEVEAAEKLKLAFPDPAKVEMIER